MWCEQEEVPKALKDIQEDYLYSRDAYDYLINHSKVGFSNQAFGNELKQLNTDIQRLWGHKEEIKSITHSNLSYQNWKLLTEGKSDGLYLLHSGDGENG